MDLVFTRKSLLRDELLSDVLGKDFEAVYLAHVSELGLRALEAMGIDDRVPFVLTGSAERDPVLSQVFCTLSGLVSGRTTMTSYGHHAFRLLRWLGAQGKGLEDVSTALLGDYKRSRRTNGVSPRSWNPEAAAIKRFLDAAVIEGLLPSNPCDHPLLPWFAKGASAAPEEPSFITLEQFRKFRDRGLQTGRYALRNTGFANLLLSTGMRVSEGNHYMTTWIPEKASFKAETRSVKHLVRAEAAKGGRSRMVRVSKGAVQAMVQYRDYERQDMVERALSRGAIQEEPQELWLNQSARPIERNGWETVFRRASEVSGVKVTPHSLRHTFAVYVLSRLIQATIGSVRDAKGEAARVRKAGGHTIYESLFGDPLRQVQRLLGHSRYETTFIYLDVLAANDLVTDAALSVFEEVIDHELDYADAEF